ncbi:MAG: preprotein translocase subunit SecA [Candidatus Fimivivens sp.]|nr:preprotein translocase subunit SecA [Oscillospiraceae bacterium]MCM0707079.1 preprotein translocase subunit SecA [Faecalicatena sp. BF-R-105]MDY3219544.1 preprotein translocase subunit SecA [Candidatus Fimivivens sp.]SFJ17749.1 preprotein translocase subunit SecA [Ruminococcaceae bacterium D5]GKH51471.1 protein translocase subunit SecA [Eubacteriales bacterium]
MGLLDKIFGSYSDKELKRIRPISDQVLALEEKYAALDDHALQACTPALKERLAAGESLDDILPDAFAACREAAWRVLGMKHFPVQIIGGIVLHQGRIAEMKTGEGKTLVATLPAYLNALTGQGVHIVTVNDYLARRDSEWMGKVHRFMGLTVGLAVPGMSPEEKRAAYACDITYGTNNEFGFDYLRDNMVVYKEQLVQREHAFAIVDEVDSILIDEARTPLIISGTGDQSTDLYERADRFAKTLKRTKVVEMDSKQEQDEVEGDYIVDEKARTATLTQSGVKKAERYFNIENLTDAENLTLSHHINQAIKANGVMQRDVDYVVKDGEVIIVDEFTGRLMIGRRYNEGLHQAIEAKEGVKVERESKTLATITFQNYFRMYKKLSGMTGTALTEENEFREIYNLDVIVIPTNRPVVRKDYDDVVYRTEKGKYNAVIEQVAECHRKGQPVLVGTISIDKSELLSSMLKRKGIPHEVLNAKHHEREAAIVAQAGQYGAVTIATNMAGRGTDIMLGGNVEYLAKNEMRRQEVPEELIEQADGHADTDDQAVLDARTLYASLLQKYKSQLADEAQRVRDAGGLFIIGTERHESRRIDNQLRGRSGRQGDPGETRFFLSLEDDLMRLFGGDRIQNLMDTFKVDEDTPIEAKLLSSTIESAQAKVEGRNFSIRKNVLQFDDVMNRQRETIYSQRMAVINGEDFEGTIQKMFDGVIDDAVELYLTGDDDKENWNLNGLRDYLLGWIAGPDDLRYSIGDCDRLGRDGIRSELQQRAHQLYAAREAEWGSKLTRDLERMVLLKNVDVHWMDHIDAMDELRRGIYLRGYGQRDPVVEYRMEGSEMYDGMVQSIREDTVRMLLTLRVRVEAPVQREQVAKPAEPQPDGSSRPVQRTSKKVGRNDPCPCGSGKKYKHCCGR